MFVRVIRVVPVAALFVAFACAEPPKPASPPAASDATTVARTPTGHYDVSRDPAADLTAAVSRATAETKRILMVVGGEWCVWCHILNDYLEANPDIRRTWDDHYVTLFVNFSPENENKTFLSNYPRIDGYPHIFVLDTTGAFLHSQDTARLEEGRSYAAGKVREFLDRWKRSTS